MNSLELFKKNLQLPEGQLYKIWGLYFINLILSKFFFISLLFLLAGLIFLPYSFSPESIIKPITQFNESFSSIEVFLVFFAVFFIIFQANIFFCFTMINWLPGATFSFKKVFSKIPLLKTIFCSLTLSLLIALSALMFINSSINGVFQLLFSIFLILIVIPLITALIFISLPFSSEDNIIKAFLKTKSLYEEKVPLEFNQIFRILFTSFFIYSLIILSLLSIDFKGNFSMVTISFSLLLTMFFSLFVFPFSIITLINSQRKILSELMLKKSKFPVYIVSPVILLVGIILLISLDTCNTSRLEKMSAQLGSDLEKIKDLNKFSRPVLRGKPIPGNAATKYLILLDLAKKNKKIDPGEIESLLSKNNTIKPIPEIFNKYQQEINQIRNASQFDYVKFPLKLRFNSPLPDFIKAQNLGTLMTSSMVEKWRSGFSREGIELLLDTIRFGQDIGNSGSLIAVLVGEKIIRTAINSFSENLDQSKLRLSFAEYNELLPQIENLRKSNLNAKKGFLIENATLKNELLRLGTNKSDSNVIGSGSDFYYANYFLVKFVKPEIIDALEKMGEFENIFADFDKPYYQTKLKIEAQNAEVTGLTQKNFVLGMIIPNYSGITERVSNNIAKVDGFYIMIALQAYYAKYNKYPENLKAMDPEITSNLPKDSFTGIEFIYKRKGFTDFSLYSPGVNLKDDNSSNKDDLIIYPVNREMKS